jgi:uncharacterized membrane protein YfcA
MAAETRLPLAVFLGGSAALVLVTFLGVSLGGLISHWLPEGLLQKIAGASFILIGGLMLWGKGDGLTLGAIPWLSTESLALQDFQARPFIFGRLVK